MSAGSPDSDWLPALARHLGGPVTIVGRTALTGGYVADAVVRVDLDGAPPVVVKRATPAEVAAMRALAVVRGVDHPRLLAAGADWLVTPYYPGEPLAEGPDVPDEVWTTLARVHAHWLGRRPRGLPVTDAAWWRQLCVVRILPHLRAAGQRCTDPVLAAAVDALTSWSEDPRMQAALALLPRTLTHGDAHRGNILCAAPPRAPSPHLAAAAERATWQTSARSGQLDAADGAGAGGDGGVVLIDWGNARVAPPGFDLAVLRAQGAVDLSVYRAAVARLGHAPAPVLLAVEEHCADVYSHVGYLGFAADHLGPARVAEMVDGAAQALAALGPALRALVSSRSDGR